MNFLPPVFILLLPAMFLSQQVIAKIITDGSVGSTVTLTGPDFVINEALGTRAGDNLFHSFQTFSIQSGQSALFTGSADIANVISRVTGSDPSQINGRLQSSIGQADFWFFNPNGVIFGKQAQIDVPAAFHVATADQLQFTHDADFSALPVAGSSLAITSPEGFGFLETNQARILFNNSQLNLAGTAFHAEAENIGLNNAQIDVGGGSTGSILLKGGNLILVNSKLTATNSGDQDAESGIRLEGAEITLTDSMIQSSVLGTGAGSTIKLVAEQNITLQDHSRIESFGYADGDIAGISIKASDLMIRDDRSGIGSYRISGSGEDYGLYLDLNGALTLRDNAVIKSETFSAGDAGDIIIRAATASIGTAGGGSRAKISSDTVDGPGSAGKVSLVIDGKLILNDGAVISSDTYQENPIANQGHAGIVSITARTLILDSRASSKITGFSSRSVSGNGNAGTILIDVAEDMTSYSSFISSDSSTRAEAGEINIKVGGNLSLIGDGKGLKQSGISSTSRDPSINGGNAGNISIQAGNLLLENNAFIASDTRGGGKAGIISIKSGDIKLDGSRGETRISSQSQAKGSAGDIILAANKIELIKDAYISSDTQGIGEGGSITINSQLLSIDAQGEGRADISAGSYGLSEAAGDAGFIKINSEAVYLTNGGRIESDSNGGGDAGKIMITSDLLSIQGSNRAAEISSDTRNSGNAGEIIIKVNRLILNGLGEGANIFSESTQTSTGNAGDINIDASESISLMGNASISSNTRNSGNGGVILLITETLTLSGENGRRSISSGAFGPANKVAGNAGNIKIRVAGDVRLLGASVIESNSDGRGDAGEIDLQASNLFMQGGSGKSIIQSDTRTVGQGGEITLKISGDIRLGESASITTNTSGKGQAGTLLIRAENLILGSEKNNAQNKNFTIISSSSRGGTGDSGTITFEIENELQLTSGGIINNSTTGAGNAGVVTIDADNILINGEGYTATISSNTKGSGNAGTVKLTARDSLVILDGGRITSDTSSSGNAGTVTLHLKGRLDIIRGGVVSSSTRGSGNAGSVSIIAGSLLLSNAGNGADGVFGRRSRIASEAIGDELNQVGSAGQIIITSTGDILLSNDVEISIASEESNPQGSFKSPIIKITANKIILQNDSNISARSNGSTDAANIFINTADGITLKNVSSITTASEEANAGSIEILGGLLHLQQSKITTSVSGDKGNGGNINLETRGLILDQGFIQANTAAAGADGGTIEVESPFLLIPTNQQFISGGNQRYVFDPNQATSVIQAAAPDGTTGTIELEVPEVDLSASILAVDAGFSQLAQIDANPCILKAGEIPSSLALSGRGSLPPDLSQSQGETMKTCAASGTK